MALAQKHQPLPESAEKKPLPPSLDMESVLHELAAFAKYVTHIKGEIGALRANELHAEQLPEANADLNVVVDATANATNAIMAAAEEIMNSTLTSPTEYRAAVESKIIEIFEACTFQDITGQRIRRVAETLNKLERRLKRFAHAVNTRDASALEETAEEREREQRKKDLILTGPQDDDIAISQDDIDSLFD
jgi:chemotaxis protein CheZ